MGANSLRTTVSRNPADNTVHADIFLVLVGDVNIREVSRNVQLQVSRAITEMVGMDVGYVNIHIEDVEYDGDATS